MTEKKPRKLSKNDTFLLAAAKVLTGNLNLDVSCWIQVPGWALTVQRKNFRHFIAQGTADSVIGASVVSGWSLEWLRRVGRDGLEAVFAYHSIVRMPDGRLMCPTAMQGEEISFLPDPERFYDHETKVGYNLAFFSNKPTEQSVAGFQKTIFPLTVAWRAPLGHGNVMSTQAKHAQRVAYGFGDPFQLAGTVGADQNSFVDMTFVSDLDDVLTFMGITDIPDAPDERLKLLKDVHSRFVQGELSSNPATV